MAQTDYDIHTVGRNKKYTKSKNNRISTESYTSRSKFRGGGFYREMAHRLVIILLYLWICIILPGAGTENTNVNSLFSSKGACSFVPKRLTNEVCICKPSTDSSDNFLSLMCRGLDSTNVFFPVNVLSKKSNTAANQKISTNSINSIPNENTISQLNILNEEESAWRNVKTKFNKIVIEDSNLKCVGFQNFKAFPNLTNLTITNSNVTKVDCDNQNNKYVSDKSLLSSVTHLDLSGNLIHSVKLKDLNLFPNLHSINLSRNALQHLEDVFSNQKQLIRVDLSSNHLSANLKSSVFNGLTKSPNLAHLDISGRLILFHNNDF